METENSCLDLVARIRQRRGKKRHFSKRTFPPITADQLEAAERAIGFPLPEALRCMHRHIGSGDLGLACDFLPLMGKILPPRLNERYGDTVLEIYLDYKRNEVASTPTDSMAEWPDGLLPFCEWPETYSCIDCTKEGFPVLIYDSYPSLAYRLCPHKDTFDEWLEDLVAGKDLWAEMGKKYNAFLASLKDDNSSPPDEAPPPPTDADWDWLHSS